MGFFDTLRRVLGPGDDRDPKGVKIDEATGYPSAEPGPDADDAGLYDRTNWHKKLKRILNELPGSQGEWPELVTEGRALNLDPAWVKKCQVDEFLMMVRRAVADGLFSEAEHRKLDLARDLIGIPEAEAEAALHLIVGEAETFFGKAVEGA